MGETGTPPKRASAVGYSVLRGGSCQAARSQPPGQAVRMQGRHCGAAGRSRQPQHEQLGRSQEQSPVPAAHSDPGTAPCLH